MSNLVQKFQEYSDWRRSVMSALDKYRGWVTATDLSDAACDQRFNRIQTRLVDDKLSIAFVAEFSRGKSELINAIFFADYGQRILPSSAGRTTMCPTEIFWDALEEPSIKLLPIGTRATDDSLTHLKTTPNVWQKFKLNVDSPDEMKEVLRKLIDQKEVTQGEAEELGLFNPQDIGMIHELETLGLLKIPVWRHAIINYPHPLLKSGLVIIDTPGLNTLGAEPELTLNIIPNAHAVIFLTATDTGITQSDMQIWNEFIKDRSQYKLVLLNKIDMLWDDLKSTQAVTNEIEKQVNATAYQLGISPEDVFAVSAQKALVAKIKKNDALLEQSGLLALENTLGNQIVQAKHEILGRTVASECSEMIKQSRKIVQQRLNNLRAQITELRGLRGKNDDASKGLLAKVVTDRKRYEASIPTFNHASDKINHIGKKILRHLSLAYLDTSLAESRQDIGDSWTTVGLNQGMRNLMKQANDLAEFINKESNDIKKLADNIYEVFQSKHGFDIFSPPTLDMLTFTNNMKALEKITNDFCSDPINLLTEKHFLIRKFFLGLGTQTKHIFAQTEADCKRWIEDILNVLIAQMNEHKSSLEQRTQNLAFAKANTEALETQLNIVEQEYAIVAKESQNLDIMLLQLIKAVKPAAKAKAAEKNNVDFEKTLKLSSMPFLNVAQT